MRIFIIKAPHKLIQLFVSNQPRSKRERSFYCPSIAGDVKDFNLIAADAAAITTSCNHVVVYITERYEIMIVGRVGMIYISLSIVT